MSQVQDTSSPQRAQKLATELPAYCLPNLYRQSCQFTREQDPILDLTGGADVEVGYGRRKLQNTERTHRVPVIMRFLQEANNMNGLFAGDQASSARRHLPRTERRTAPRLPISPSE